MIQRVVRTCDNNKVTCVLYEETSKERIKGMGSMLPFISYEKLCAEKAPERTFFSTIIDGICFMVHVSSRKLV